MNNIKKLIKKILPKSLFQILMPFWGKLNLKILARSKRVSITSGSDYIDFSNENRVIRLSKEHWFYGSDLLNSYEYYFNSVKPLKKNSTELVDFSTPRFHEVNGFDLMPVFFPSFCEPMSTTDQYLNFAKLHEGSTVIDLGAYSGLTSILFKELVGESGKVIAVDADSINLDSIKKNFNLYEKITGKTIDILNGAIWNHCDGLNFSSEGNMGSSATDIVGDLRGKNNIIKSYTLSKLAEIYNLEDIHFIKCDIEGAERVIFEDVHFFKNFKPRIIIECHFVDELDTSVKCIEDLTKYGYTCKHIEQHGVSLPLLECRPTEI